MAWPLAQEHVSFNIIKPIQYHFILVTGAILRMPIIESLNDYEYFEDGKYWEIEEEEDEDEQK